MDAWYSFYSRVDVKAVGTENQTEKQLVQHCYSRREREKLLEKKTEVPSGEFLM